MANKSKPLGSNFIKVYPTALRGGVDYSGTETIYDPESRLGTEFNLTNPINRLTIDGSFVISNDSNSIEFSINGYYFKVTSLSELTSQFSDYQNIYANIRIEELSNNTYRLKSLVAFESGQSTNLDVEGQGFVGCYFSDEPIQGSTIHSLKILKKSGSSWVVPESSLLKFDANSIMIDADKSDNSTSLHDVLYKDSSNKMRIKADEFEGHLTGDVTGNLDGNAKTATDSEYSSKIGTSENHPAIGSSTNFVYVDNQGKINSSRETVGSYNQPIYLKNGQFVEANKITVSTVSPSSTTGFNEGDIWIQYIA